MAISTARSPSRPPACGGSSLRRARGGESVRPPPPNSQLPSGSTQFRRTAGTVSMSEIVSPQPCVAVLACQMRTMSRVAPVRRPDPHRMSSAKGMRTSQARASLTIMTAFSPRRDFDPLDLKLISNIWNMSNGSSELRLRRKSCRGGITGSSNGPRTQRSGSEACRRGGHGPRQSRRPGRPGADPGLGAARHRRPTRRGRCVSRTLPTPPASPKGTVHRCSRRWSRARFLQLDSRDADLPAGRAPVRDGAPGLERFRPARRGGARAGAPART